MKLQTIFCEVFSGERNPLVTLSTKHGKLSKMKFWLLDSDPKGKPVQFHTFRTINNEWAI